MSFVDMMDDSRWEFDVLFTRRTEAELRSQWTEDEELILNRDVWAVAKGMAPMTPELQARNDSFAADAFLCRQLGLQARADWAAKKLAMDYEAARAQLAALPPVPTDGSTDPVADARAQLQAQLAAASADTLALVADRDAWRAAQNPPEASP